MKTFTCQICGHVAFDQMPVECPVCGAAIENFEADDEAIKKPVDPENLSETEQKHMPQIVIRKECGLHQDGDCSAAQVTVGSIAHVMESEHYIKFIDFYIDRKYISRVIFTPKNNHPAVTLDLCLTQGTLSAVASCNVHGNWRARTKLADA